MGVFGINLINKSKKWLYLSIFFTFFFTNQVIYGIIVSFWAIPLTPIKSVEKADIAIVLGGASRIDLSDTNRVFLNDGEGDRIIHAIQLYKMGKVDKILFTSGSADVIGMKYSEALFARKLFIMLGVAPEDLILETKSRNTYENALFSSQIIKKDYPKKKYLLVTNSLHEKRGLACFEKQGIHCTPFSINTEGGFYLYQFSGYIVPSAHTLTAWDRFLHEFIGYWVYKIKGYC